MKVKCQFCKNCDRNCEWLYHDICYFEPNDYDGDIGSATVDEMRKQNDEVS